MGYARVWLKGSSVVIVGSGHRRCKHEHLLEENGFKVITKFYSNGQPTPVDGFGWRGDKYFVINNRIAKMQRIMDGVDGPYMVIVNKVRHDAGVKAHKNRTNREKLVVGATVTKHQVPLFSCPKCGKILSVKVRGKWDKFASQNSHELVYYVQATCCRVQYQFNDVARTHGCLRVAIETIQHLIRRGVTEYTAIVGLLPDDIQFTVGVLK